MQGAKAIAAGEGGVAVTNSRDDYLRMSLWGHFNRHGDRFIDIGLKDFEHTGLGYKRRIAPLSALLAQADLDEIDATNVIMNDTAKKLDSVLEDVSGVLIPILPDGSRRGGFFCGYAFSLSDDSKATSEDAIDGLSSIGVRASGYPFVPFQKLSVYVDIEYRHRVLKGVDATPKSLAPVLPNTEILQKKMILLSRRHLVTLSTAKIERIADVLQEIAS